MKTEKIQKIVKNKMLNQMRIQMNKMKKMIKEIQKKKEQITI